MPLDVDVKISWLHFNKGTTIDGTVACEDQSWIFCLEQYMIQVVIHRWLIRTPKFKIYEI